MLSPSSESQPMEVTVALGGASPDVSATRRVAALASTASRFQILDASVLEEEERAADWADADPTAAWDRTHLLFGNPTPVPAPSVLSGQPPGGASFPLLDDDGHVIEGLQMLPYRAPEPFAESTAEFGFPLGPLIWEPEAEGESQICMDPEDKDEAGAEVSPERGIARLSASDIALPAPSPFEREIVVPFRGVMLPPVPAAVPVSESPALGEHHSTTPSQTHPHEGPKENMASILESLRNEAARNGETSLHEQAGNGDTTTAPSLASERSASNQPLSFADWMLSAQQQEPAHPPQRQRASRFMVDEEHESSSTHRDSMRANAYARPHETRQNVTEEQPPPGTPYDGPALVYHRSVAPMAPVGQTPAPASSRPLALILAILILTVALLAVAIWGDGYRPRGKESPPPPWTQEAVPVQESAAASVP